MIDHTRSTHRLTTVAGASAGGALLCGVCCVAPFVLPAALLASFGSALAWIGRLHLWMSILALGLVLLAWAWVAVVSLRERRRPAVSNLVVLSAASLALALALAWPALEPGIIAALRR